MGALGGGGRRNEEGAESAQRPVLGGGQEEGQPSKRQGSQTYPTSHPHTCRLTPFMIHSVHSLQHKPPKAWG